MKNLFKQGKSAIAEEINEPGSSKLYVAYLNESLIKNLGKADNAYQNSFRNGKESVFSTTSGSYYINGVPAILSKDEEAMLYDAEYSEYY